MLRAGGARASTWLAALGAIVLLAHVRAVEAEGPGTSTREVAVSAGGCEVRLEQPGNEREVLLLRPGCPLSAGDAADALARLLAALFPAGAGASGVRSLSVGRIEALPWLSERLSLAAARDAAWDARRGRPRRGSDNAAVAALLVRDQSHRELDAALAAAGLTVAGDSVEKVLVGRADSLPAAAKLRAAGVAPAARLPFDAQLWLRLVPVDTPPPVRVVPPAAQMP